jgi:hypothetical protein
MRAAEFKAALRGKADGSFYIQLCATVYRLNKRTEAACRRLQRLVA